KPEVPIIPFTIDGSYRVYEETGILTSGVPIRFTIHPPIDTKGLSRSQIKELDNRVEDLVRSGL
ncbi:MAG TPA: 1-acyl-sn-glycerol-3-phosphate acyltransferase, partial [Bacillota bacterium]|nr:1-acyl-sn-glycerol-3-phosphate acyltransferase [Bacillota bacterium]